MKPQNARFRLRDVLPRKALRLSGPARRPRAAARRLISSWGACLLVALAAASGVGRGAEPKVIEEIVAKVNGDIITLSDLQRELQEMREQLESQYSDPAVVEKEYARLSPRALKNLVENKLMLQKAEESGLTVNIDVDVAAAVESVRKESGIPDMKAFEQALNQQGLTMEAYRDSLRKRLLYDRLINRYVQSKITVMDSEITQYYQRELEKFTRPAEVDVSEILLVFEGRQKSESRAKAEQALAALNAGDDFAEVAKKFSEGATAGKGGGIGAFKKGTLSAPLEKAVFALEPGQHTGIVDTDYGFVIMKLNKRTDATAAPLDEVRSEIQRQIYYDKLQPELSNFAEGLRLHSYVYVSPKYKEQYRVE
ncbi:MAG: SurA N-terminal domain-containing protein [Acidobacteria bacterium]|nr:SurA N-terminal domain-containing protein [Acidobacteriota bacterium]